MEYDQRNDVEKLDEIMLPGFRFHPTDEELVGFYLKRKVQQKPLSIELIKQLDIYKFDPWDLPKMASTGEKEWYFYCPRDRKYRNSARPNRVTGAGFWKATGTDRPIYSSEGNKCIGLKKSLVFYRGRAAKGLKTDWMMHEFRLPSVADGLPTKRSFIDKQVPLNDSWAICRIFKKSNSAAQRVLSHSWVSPVLEYSSAASDHVLEKSSITSHWSSKNLSMVAERSSTSSNLDYASDIHSYVSHDFGSLEQFPYFKPLHPMVSNGNHTNSPYFSPLETMPSSRSQVDVPSLLLNMSSTSSTEPDYFNNDCTDGCQPLHSKYCISSLSQVMQKNANYEDDDPSLKPPNLVSIDDSYQWGEGSSNHSSGMAMPMSLPLSFPWENTIFQAHLAPRALSPTSDVLKGHRNS